MKEGRTGNGFALFNLGEIKMPYPLIAIFIFMVLALLFNAQLESKLFTKRLHPWLEKHSSLFSSYQSIAALIGFPVVIIGGIFTYTQIIERLDTPAVGLEFVHKKSVAVYTVNFSNVVVYDPKYWFALFNIDRPFEKRKHPLQIPVSKGDYVRIGDKLGPNAMMSIAVDKNEVKIGDRILGMAAVTCPKCITRRYWIYIQHGQGGWYAEMDDEELQAITLPIFHPSSDIAVSAFFKAVDEKRRMPIE